MSDIIDLLEKIKERKEALDAQYSEDDYAWENQVDLTLQDLTMYIEQVVVCSKAMVEEIEDLHRDVADLKRTVQLLIRQLYIDKQS